MLQKVDIKSVDDIGLTSIPWEISVIDDEGEASVSERERRLHFL